ncbi:MAG: flavin reductase domain protein FMN-binding protein [Firmicutes bacterium]|nr:flavin reductase domain protein FMN-binding protein [Bacillota bacterium]
MSTEVSYNEYAVKAMEQLAKGAFLTTAHDGKKNTMTIGWGTLGFSWGKPVFMIMVRQSRFSYQLIENSNEFTVSIPFKDMKQALALCGSKSGRNLDKFKAAGLTANPGKKIATPVIADCGLHYECKVVYKQTMTSAQLAPAHQTAWYADGDYHTLYFGEIQATYID